MGGSTATAAATTSKKAAFIGLGNMGLPMAQNLHKSGFHVSGFDLNQNSMNAAKESGIDTASSVEDAVKGADFVVMALPRTQDVEKVLNMDGGIFKSLGKGAVICDTSTISPLASRKFHEESKALGFLFCDTPMSGGIMGAQKGTLTFMVGCSDESEFEQCKPLLEGMGKNFFNCGGPGNGGVAKICNNLILGIQMNSISEGFNLGKQLGLEPSQLQEIFSLSTTKCWSNDVANPVPGVAEGSPANNDYNGGFGVGLIKKDLALAIECGEQVGAKTVFAEESMKYYEAIENAGHGAKDFGITYQYIKNQKDVTKL